MRVECEACHELVAASFAVTGDAVRATCPACRQVMSAPLAAAAPDDVPTCPKCGAPRGAAGACARCGLAAERMAAFEDARDAAVPEAVREAWAHAIAAWSEPARHDDVLRQVAAHNSYAWAAARYRTRGRDPIAQRQLDRLRRAAEATLLASATVRPDTAARPYRATAGVLAVLVAAILVGLIYAAVIRAPAATAPTSPPQPLTPGRPVSPSTIR
jgi:uncharacterized Zn finger protein (UPF0148 family)